MAARQFWQWFEAEMARRGFRSVRKVERAGDVGNDTISGRQRSGMPPTDTVIRAIAAAFGLTFEEVEAVAHDSDVVPERAAEADREPSNLTLRELLGIVSEMPVEEQRAVLDYALYRRSRSGEREDARSSPAPGATRRTPAATDSGS